MTTSPKRRWSFSLRTLFVVVTGLSLLVLLAIQSARINSLQQRVDLLQTQNQALRTAGARAHSDILARHPKLLTVP